MVSGQENAAGVSLTVVTELPELQEKEQSRGGRFGGGRGGRFSGGRGGGFNDRRNDRFSGGRGGGRNRWWRCMF